MRIAMYSFSMTITALAYKECLSHHRQACFLVKCFYPHFSWAVPPTP
jgi:hypothetical protein